MIFVSVAVIVCFLPFPNRENKIFTKLSGNNFLRLPEFRGEQQVSKLWQKRVGGKNTELRQKHDTVICHGTAILLGVGCKWLAELLG